MDIAGMLGGMPGDASGWQGGIAQPTASVTDLSAHVDGGSGRFGQGQVALVHGGSVATAGALGTAHFAAGIVVAAIVALWVLGLLVFKGSNN